MTTITKELIVPYSAEAMYNLVNDIEKYPEFLPWCSSSKILEANQDSITADLELTYASITKKITTRNELSPATGITMNLVDGPLQHLHGKWEFKSIGDANNHATSSENTLEGCKVSLNLDFAFDNSFMGMAFGKVFQGIANELVDHFYKRAKQVYG